MIRKKKIIFLGVMSLLCMLNLFISPINVDANDASTKGGVFLKEEIKTPTLTDSSSNRVDQTDSPIKKTGKLPMTGELMKPLLMVFGITILMMIPIGFLLSSDIKKEGEV